MKALFLLLTACAVLTACGTKTAQTHGAGNGNNIASTASVGDTDYVEVIYFHGKQRCKTCIAIECGTEELINNQLAAGVSEGDIVYRNIDISLPENEEIADKYEVTWSSLFVVKHINGTERVTNLTEMAFASALKDPDGFKAMLKEVIESGI